VIDEARHATVNSDSRGQVRDQDHTTRGRS